MASPASKPSFRRSRLHYAVTVHGLIFAGTGIFILCYAISSPRRDRAAAASWRQTICTITSVTPGNAVFGTHTSPSYNRIIQFIYSVDGHQFVSNGMDFRSYWGMHGSEDRNYAEFVSRFHAGKKVPCWYDPEHPERAVLTLDMVASPNFSYCLMGIGFILGGLGIACFGWSGFGEKLQFGRFVSVQNEHCLVLRPTSHPIFWVA